mmetsp:Transcript_32987/g.53107  ORF Transcript_32987/g.53107 Transcript_32987/m.53107 type:complete len:701 (-) Transcript_32987:985-3087(-)
MTGRRLCRDTKKRVVAAWHTRLLVPVALWAAAPGLSASAFSPSAPVRPLSSLGRRSFPAFLARSAAAQGAYILQGQAFASPRLRGGAGGAARMSASVDSLAQLAQNADHSWLQQLNMDPETDKYAPNKESRQVRSGHYVKVKPTALPKPKYIIHSKAMAETLGISEADVQSDRFIKFFSGDQAQLPGMESWATPYALSIMGSRHVNNCPFGNGNGYGDGRAQSIGEVVVEGKRWEMQLKGGGKTPFCRGADGRAVLRSSIREFIASEAMFALGVSTTRALSLVLSEGETTRRPWYSGRNDAENIDENDPRLAKFPPEQRRQLVEQLKAMGGKDPDVMIEEKCAITTRVSPSFLRIGHVDLFARRVSGTGKEDAALRRQELEKIVEHALFREYPEVQQQHEGESLSIRTKAMLVAAGEKLGALAAGWLRIGFCQGNFNADNCLVGGRTMDYGPFGWMDQYDPLFAKWTGSGEHFAFINQPNAALANFQTFAVACGPLLEKGDADVREVVIQAKDAILEAVRDTWRRKLGFAFPASADRADLLWKEMEPLMQAGQADWITLWRQMAYVAALPEGTDDVALLAPLDAWGDNAGAHSAWYAPLKAPQRADWIKFLRKWRAALEEEGERAGAKTRMLKENPKFVPREWMLVEAYETANKGDFALVHQLHELLLDPYGEGTPALADKYYRTAPKVALSKGGTAFMS